MQNKTKTINKKGEANRIAGFYFGKRTLGASREHTVGGDREPGSSCPIDMVLWIRVTSHPVSLPVKWQ